MINYWIWILDMNQHIFWIDFWIDSSSFDWCHELSFEIWICLLDYDYELMVCKSEYPCYQGSVSLCAHRIWTLVGRGSHQPVWTDHPTVRSLMLIAFWFFDEFYHMIFLLWPIWEHFHKNLKPYLYIYFSLLYYLVCVYWTLSTHWVVELTISLFILFRLIAW